MSEDQSESELGKMELPSKEELAKLPRQALVAFAGRCARRVQPLFKHGWPGAPQNHIEAIEQTNTLVQLSAMSPTSMRELREAHTAASHASHAAASYANRLNDVYVAADMARGADADAAAAADAAADAAVHAALVAVDSTNDAANARDVARAAFAAVKHTARAQAGDRAAGTSRATIAVIARIVHSATVRHDYELLKTAVEREKWTDDTPVPPEFFGPLWPDGEPKGWPDECKEPRLDQARFELTVEGPDGASEEEVLETTRQLVVLLDRLNRASGGRGVRIDDETNVYERRLKPRLMPSGGHSR